MAVVRTWMNDMKDRYEGWLTRSKKDSYLVGRMACSYSRKKSSWKNNDAKKDGNNDVRKEFETTILAMIVYWPKYLKMQEEEEVEDEVKNKQVLVLAYRQYTFG